jgi:hypothetical protein
MGRRWRCRGRRRRSWLFTTDRNGSQRQQTNHLLHSEQTFAKNVACLADGSPAPNWPWINRGELRLAGYGAHSAPIFMEPSRHGIIPDNLLARGKKPERCWPRIRTRLRSRNPGKPDRSCRERPGDHSGVTGPDQDFFARPLTHRIRPLSSPLCSKCTPTPTPPRRCRLCSLTIRLMDV